MSDIVSINLQIADATVPQRNFSNPLILGLFDYDDNITGPLASGVYFTDNGLASGNQVRVKKYETLTAVAEDFKTTSEEYKMAATIFWSNNNTRIYSYWTRKEVEIPQNLRLLMQSLQKWMISI